MKATPLFSFRVTTAGPKRIFRATISAQISKSSSSANSASWPASAAPPSSSTSFSLCSSLCSSPLTSASSVLNLFPFLSSHPQHHFPKLLGVLQIIVRRDAIAQIKHLVHGRFQSSLRHQLQHRAQLRLRSHVRPHDRKLPRKQKSQIKFRVVARRRAACHQPPACRQALHAVFPCRHANVLYHHVHSAVVRQSPYLFRNRHDAVMDHLVRAQLFRFAYLFVVPRRPTHPPTEKLRDLDPPPSSPPSPP